jgi:two-component system nitrogen regulation response regulator GlnG
MKPKLLLVDDGDRHVELAHRFLREYRYATRCDLPGPCWSCAKRRGCTLTHAHDLAEAEEALRRHGDVDAVLLDIAFDLPAERLVPSEEPDLERRRRLQGLEILGELRRRRVGLPVVLMTSKEELADAAGAALGEELVTLAGGEAFDARALGLLIERVLAERRSVAAAGDYQWGRSTEMARVRRDALALARTSLPVLILGETGTGKSALAEKVIHAASGRGAEAPFVAVDLASLPSTLVAAELFGAVRGAFSGAVDRAGRLEAAHGGTLFLDEIGNLPPEVQRMLLLALESGRVTRLGESASRRADFKLVAATHADLAAAVERGQFRADLYARLNPSAPLLLPPLRDRLADLDELLSAFVRAAFTRGSDRRLLADYAEAAGLPAPLEVSLAVGEAPARPHGVHFVLSRSSLTLLRAHPWPGNVRELKLVAASAAVLALSDALEAARRGSGGTELAPSVVPVGQQLIRRLLRPAAAPAARRVLVEIERASSLHKVARNLERQLYQRLHAECGGDFAAMARQLLGEGGPKSARRVRLRFNQLGLRARKS